MEGSVTLWLPSWYSLKTRRHPYQRTYRPNVAAKYVYFDLLSLPPSLSLSLLSLCIIFFLAHVYSVYSANRWEKDNNYCKDVILKPSSEFYYGVLEYTDTAVYDFLMGECAHMCRCGGRVVKAMDLKSIGVSPHRFESCPQRFFCFTLLYNIV